MAAIARDVLQGLDFLHQHDHMHRDLKVDACAPACLPVTFFNNIPSARDARGGGTCTQVPENLVVCMRHQHRSLTICA